MRKGQKSWAETTRWFYRRISMKRNVTSDTGGPFIREAETKHEQIWSKLWYGTEPQLCVICKFLWKDTHSLIMQCALYLLGYVQCPHFTLKTERTEVTSHQHRLEDNRAHDFPFEEHTDCSNWNGTRFLLVYTWINIWSHINQLCQTYVTPITAFVYGIL